MNQAPADLDATRAAIDANDLTADASAFLTYEIAVFLPVEELAVVYDDVNLDHGRLKINQEGGTGGHNGIEDLFNKIGRGFIRFRIGVGPKYPSEMDLADFVLGKFSKSEADVIKQQMDHYHQAVDLLLNRGVTIAMNQFNKRKAKHDADKSNL